MRHARPRGVMLQALLAVMLAAPLTGQTPVTTPAEQFGHELGADYQLPNYQQLMQYWQKLAVESDRMVLDTIGETAEGRPQLMAIVTAPENHRSLGRYRDTARRLALAEGLTDEQARALAREGKAVVWIDGGLHATEVLGAQQLMETLYQFVSGTDEETTRILNDVIILFVHANPDGMDLVSDWYMRNPDPQKRSTGGVPRLYQKYIGHDNNRDFFASVQAETENMNRIMYREWFPQIVYNHHQTGPQGTVLFAPPFRDPFNHNIDPLVVVGIDMVGSAMHSRFVLEDKPGATMRGGASYSTWWNGGLRTTAYFHNMIGLLTETIGNPTPIRIPFIPQRQLPNGDLPSPIEPQEWHFRQSVDYSVTANRAVLDLASKHREDFLFGIYKAGKNSIERGSRDSWTNYPKRIAAAEKALGITRGQGGGGGGGFGQPGATREQFEQMLRAPELRDPRGYIIPASQPDFPTAAKFVEALLETGVTVQRATQAFQVAGKSYPAGSFVVKTAQAFRPHVIDMFEPQDHPNDIPYPGGPPTPPYDNAGYTLAYQMGVEFDRILEGFDAPLEPIRGVAAPLPEGRITGGGNAGWLLSHRVNDAFVAVNRLAKAQRDVFWLREPLTLDGSTWPAGTFFIPAAGNARSIVETVAKEKGLTFHAVARRPAGQALELRPVRIALWDRYGGSMPSGWTRWLLENFEFPFEVVFPAELDAGNLNAKYDVIVFVDGAIPSARPQEGQRGGGGGFGGPPDPATIPEEFRAQLGSVTAEKTVPQLRAFLEQGGSIVTIGSSTNLAEHLGLPVESALTEMENGQPRPLPRAKYYVPGSVLRGRVDTAHPLAHGMNEQTDFFFDNSPVFKLAEGAEEQGIDRLAWFEANPLRSGWAWGEQYLEGGVAAIQANVGRGKLFMFGPEIAFRAQPHGTFKFLFNSLYYGGATEARLR
jgi:hypothetical protein